MYVCMYLAGTPRHFARGGQLKTTFNFQSLLRSTENNISFPVSQVPETCLQLNPLYTRYITRETLHK